MQQVVSILNTHPKLNAHSPLRQGSRTKALVFEDLGMTQYITLTIVVNSDNSIHPQCQIVKDLDLNNILTKFILSASPSSCTSRIFCFKASCCHAVKVLRTGPQVARPFIPDQTAYTKMVPRTSVSIFQFEQLL